MRTIKLVISFDGTDYSGWQKQENGPTIQQEIERAVSLICNSPVTVNGAGRTDAGVHALGMTAHFQTTSRVSCNDFQKGLNSLLPPAVRITSIADEAPEFHARFSALAKTYRYSLCNRPIICPMERLYKTHVPYDISIPNIKRCLEIIGGTHDFSSFENVGSRDKTDINGRGAVRTLYRTKLECVAPGYLDFIFTGDGFLRQMVRNISGTILEVARGKFTVDDFRQILAARDRSQAGPTAPPQGLTLLKVHYREDW